LFVAVQAGAGDYKQEQVQVTSVTSLEMFLTPLSHLGLGLLQPVRHPHLAVHRRRGGEMLPRQLALARAPVELTEAEVAMRDEGTHAEFGGYGEGLQVIIFGRFGLRELTPRRNLAEKPQDICLSASFLMRTGEGQRSLGEGMRLLQASGQHLR